MCKPRFGKWIAVVTPDGKYFFFTSTRLGQGDIYWVDASVLNVYCPGKETI